MKGGVCLVVVNERFDLLGGLPRQQVSKAFLRRVFDIHSNGKFCRPAALEKLLKGTLQMLSSGPTDPGDCELKSVPSATLDIIGERYSEAMREGLVIEHMGAIYSFPCGGQGLENDR